MAKGVHVQKRACLGCRVCTSVAQANVNIGFNRAEETKRKAIAVPVIEIRYLP